MLKTRVITAVILVVVVIAALALLSVRLWSLAVLAVIGAAAWEWARLAKLSQTGVIVYVTITLALGLVGWFWGVGSYAAFGQFTWAYVAAAVLWIFIVPLWLTFKLALPQGWLLAVVGWLVLLPCWLAISEARLLGAVYMFLLMALVWVADIAAYFTGKKFGKNKLAPRVSPGKTWEGVGGAVAGVLLLASLAVFLPILSPNFYAQGTAGLALGILPVLLLLTAVSVEGDLLESLAKRRAGVKDSSQLLPGHGGVLDRIDALTSALPVAMAIGLLLGFVRLPG
jgi:phosphatidate cytidylyltransferase